MSEPASNGGHSLNPFARRDEFSSRSILFYKITTALSYLLLLVTTLYYTFGQPGTHHGHHKHKHSAWTGSFWWHNSPSGFRQNAIMTSVYWLILFILQLGYSWSLYANNTVYVTAAANIGSHFVANNLLLFGFINVWVRGHYWISLLLLVINFFNLSFAYFRHPVTPRHIHIATVSGPLAWNFVALYWVGALIVGNGTAARIVANVFVWSFLTYGAFFLAAYKDYTMGFAMSYLTFSTGVGQFLTHPVVVQFQWIFCFVIGAVLFLISLAVASGNSPFPRGQIVSEDQERAPLLAED